MIVMDMYNWDVDYGCALPVRVLVEVDRDNRVNLHAVVEV